MLQRCLGWASPLLKAMPFCNVPLSLLGHTDIMISKAGLVRLECVCLFGAMYCTVCQGLGLTGLSNARPDMTSQSFFMLPRRSQLIKSGSPPFSSPSPTASNASTSLGSEHRRKRRSTEGGNSVLSECKGKYRLRAVFSLTLILWIIQKSPQICMSSELPVYFPCIAVPVQS